jgi:dTDP-L-rhamnose 4-epimerase
MVCHLAAAVGVGQSMYQIEHYTSVNDIGTAILLEELADRPDIRRLLIASSMSIYGEGLARAGDRPDRAGGAARRTAQGRPLGVCVAQRSGAGARPHAGNKAALSSARSTALNKFNQERMG